MSSQPLPQIRTPFRLTLPGIWLQIISSLLLSSLLPPSHIQYRMYISVKSPSPYLWAQSLPSSPDSAARSIFLKYHVCRFLCEGDTGWRSRVYRKLGGVTSARGKRGRKAGLGRGILRSRRRPDTLGQTRVELWSKYSPLGRILRWAEMARPCYPHHAKSLHGAAWGKQASERKLKRSLEVPTAGGWRVTAPL